jgi:hypothetical protein
MVKDFIRKDSKQTKNLLGKWAHKLKVILFSKEGIRSKNALEKYFELMK